MRVRLLKNGLTYEAPGPLFDRYLSIETSHMKSVRWNSKIFLLNVNIFSKIFTLKEIILIH